MTVAARREWALRMAVRYKNAATRSGEVRGAVWTEINRDDGAWTIPAPRTKGNREHR